MPFYHNNQVLREFGRDWSKYISDKKCCKKFLGLGCCDKTASETDFTTLKSIPHKNSLEKI